MPSLQLTRRSAPVPTAPMHEAGPAPVPVPALQVSSRPLFPVSGCGCSDRVVHCVVIGGDGDVPEVVQAEADGVAGFASPGNRSAAAEQARLSRYVRRMNGGPQPP